MRDRPSTDSRFVLDDEFSEMDVGTRLSTKSLITTSKVEDARKLVGRAVTRETAAFIWPCLFLPVLPQGPRAVGGPRRCCDLIIRHSEACLLHKLR